MSAYAICGPRVQWNVTWIALFPPARLAVPDHESSQLDLPLADLAVGHAPLSEIVQAELAEPPPRPIRRRRVVLPLVLFLLTCASTFFVGATGWQPELFFSDVNFTANPDPYLLVTARRTILERWQDGVIYMGCRS